MSTVYTDGVGNKYLGDCRWGNHDVAFPSTNFLKAVDARVLNTTFLSDVFNLFSSAGWGNISVASTWPTTVSTNIFSATIPGEGSGNFFQYLTNSANATVRTETSRVTTSLSYVNSSANSASIGGVNYDYSVCCGSNSIGFTPFVYNSNYTSSGFVSGRQFFVYMGRLLNVNTNFNYYSASFINQCIMLRLLGTSASLQILAIDDGSHYIVSAKKLLLTTGRAAYSISCSDGQTPGAQWATDLWVYDNNSTLGFPVIGRAENLLIGIGSYTYLRPVKIQGSVFPDGGSPWYLPVATFAGKTLLARCYSSVT